MSVQTSVHQSVVRPSIFLFTNNYLNKCKQIFTKLGMCIDIIEIWFGIAYAQILSIFDSCLPATCPYFHLQKITSVNINGFLQNLCINIVEIFKGGSFQLRWK